MNASVVIDRTPPDVSITSPANGSVTAAPSIEVTAHATDALSGVVTATCNGEPASVDEHGLVRCAVALLPGVNDTIVQVELWSRSATPQRFRAVPSSGAFSR